MFIQDENTEDSSSEDKDDNVHILKDENTEDSCSEDEDDNVYNFRMRILSIVLVRMRMIMFIY